MKKSTDELAQSFTVTYNEEDRLIDLTFISEDVGNENVEAQALLIANKINGIFDKFPNKKWRVITDTAKTQVTSITKESKKIYQDLVDKPNVFKVAVLMGDVDTQSNLASWILKVFLKSKKKINLFTSREEAQLWLNAK